MASDEILAELVDILDVEVEQLDVLTYRVVVLASLVAADQGRWIPRSVSDLEAASEQVRLIDLRRAAATNGVTEACGLDGDVRLEQIAREVPAGWSELLDDRRSQLLEGMAHLKHVTELASSAVSRRSALAEEALAFLRENHAGTYGRPVAARPQIVRGAL